MSLANKYRPTEWKDVTEQGLVVDILKSICEAEELSNRNFLLIGPAGTGKAQPLDSKVLTPSGFIAMGDIKVGTKVYTHTGAISEVIGVYPQGKRPIYEITLSDRTKIRVSDEHLNVVYRYNQDKKVREDYCLSTLDLISFFKKSKYKLRVDVPSVDWSASDLPINPYLLGILIGDGSLCDNMLLCNSELDIVSKTDAILRRDWGCYLNKRSGNNYEYYISPCVNTTTKYIFVFEGKKYFGCGELQTAWCSSGRPYVSCDTLANLGMAYISGDVEYLERYNLFPDSFSCTVNEHYGEVSGAQRLKSTLGELGLLCKSVDKHIPPAYLLNSFENRVALLQGLFDTDGYVGWGGSPEFSTSSKQLSHDFEFLVRSLGIRDTVTIKKSGYTAADGNFVQCHDAYRHVLKQPHGLKICSSEKHTARIRKRQLEPHRNIISIEYVGDVECQCIYVNHEDHTYISDGFIPTHNTTLARLMSKKLNGEDGEIIEVDGATNSGVDSVRDIVAWAKTYPLVTKYKILIIDECHCLSSAAWAALLKTLEDAPARTIFFLCTTNPEKVPKTITSRVQQFQLSKISLSGIVARIQHILDCEKADIPDIEYNTEGITYLAKLANGGMRDALTLLDKVLIYSHKVDSQTVSDALGLSDNEDYFKLLSAVAKHDNEQIVIIVDRVYNSGLNFVKWFEDFHSFVMNIVKYILLHDISQTMIPAHYEEKLSKYNIKHFNICLRLANILMQINQELRTTNYQQEVVLTRLCTINK